MQYNPLGKTDLRVSRLCLGCMTFGEPDRGNHAWTLPEESSRPIIKRALEGGINFFDTANSYSDGSSEEIVGRALRDFSVVKTWSLPPKCSIALVIYRKDYPVHKFCALSTTACDVSAWIMSISCKFIAGITTRRSKRRWKPSTTW